MNNKNFNIIIGAQFGDEGKGKITNILSDDCDYCIRFQGGDNAGHTIVKGEKTFKLRLLPCGILENKNVIIGSGTVINLLTLEKEIEEVSGVLNKEIINNVNIDKNATIILPLYKLIDTLKENNSNSPIGTTKNGIGIAYEDKMSRIAIRANDLKDRSILSKKLTKILDKWSTFLNSNSGNWDIEQLYNINFEYLCKLDYLKERVFDCGEIIYNEYYLNNKKFVIEGAQGSLLDITHGTYPYVTSSCTTSQGVGSGIGIAVPRKSNVIGVLKAYCTRVGNGPFNSELFINNEIENHISKTGKEFGVVTGRRRRIGWLDLDDIIYSNRLNNFDELSLMKSDVLDGLKEVFIKFNNKSIKFEGWNKTKGVSSYEELHVNLKNFVNFISEKTGVPVKYISTGPAKKEMVYL
tara:strand:+ start:3009 stop:4232 length:1224 start_codon:yes stop_codon:yes gene_type:complete